MTPEEFLEDRIRDIERGFEGLALGPWSNVQYLISNMREVIKMHKNWPILVEGPEKLEEDKSDPMSFSMRLTKQMQFMTQEEYRKKFGTEPPTAPMIREFLSPFIMHPDFNQEWLA